jgi:hypothetical protein
MKNKFFIAFAIKNEDRMFFNNEIVEYHGDLTSVDIGHEEVRTAKKFGVDANKVCAISVTRLNQDQHADKQAFIDYLEENLIPDLIDDNRLAIAEDFKTCVHYMKGAK